MGDEAMEVPVTSWPKVDVKDDERRIAVGKEPVTAEGYAIFAHKPDAPKVGLGWREAWGHRVDRCEQ